MSRMRVDDIHPYASSLSLRLRLALWVSCVESALLLLREKCFHTLVVLLLLPPCQCAWRRRLGLALRPLFGFVKIVAVFWGR
jgi:hypothetical protein